ncbi:MAG TPA: type II toxin-antitoxin system PemK/MazF family toxin [Acidimicrobiales bacterium]|nr:type II toxin-antitoxin system PemK/MazF family toxin [Acidimicrobiales bacterium]
MRRSGDKRHGGRAARGRREVNVVELRVSALASVKPAPRNRLTFGAVIWAHIPFAEVDAEKTRPAVVVELDGSSVTVLPATSAASRLRFPNRHVEIDDLASAGLRRPTGIRLRTVRIDLIEIIDVVGTLAAVDAARLEERVRPAVKAA